MERPLYKEYGGFPSFVTKHDEKRGARHKSPNPAVFSNESKRKPNEETKKEISYDETHLLGT